jgi:aldose 1-epimerase
MSTNSPPSGGPTIDLAAGDAAVRVDLEHGARLASLVVAGRELLIGPPEPPDGSIRWGCFLMAPWPGRLADGRIAWRGRTFQLRRDHGRHSIHGLVHGVPWTVDEVRQEDGGEQVVAASIELGPLGWPFGGRVRQRLSLTPSGLRMLAEIEADHAMPAALGWHPWFLRGGADPRVRLDADRALVTLAMIPTGESVPVRGRSDLRDGPRLGRRRLDHAYIGTSGPATITWPDLRLDVSTAPALTTVVVHTPARGFCIEPQTAWPNALGPTEGGERARPIDEGQRGLELSHGERLTVELAIEWSNVSGNG